VRKAAGEAVFLTATAAAPSARATRSTQFRALRRKTHRPTVHTRRPSRTLPPSFPCGDRAVPGRLAKACSPPKRTGRPGIAPHSFFLTPTYPVMDGSGDAKWKQQEVGAGWHKARKEATSRIRLASIRFHMEAWAKTCRLLPSSPEGTGHLSARIPLESQVSVSNSQAVCGNHGKRGGGRGWTCAGGPGLRVIGHHPSEGSDHGP
jgi:hypothetical protein